MILLLLEIIILGGGEGGYGIAVLSFFSSGISALNFDFNVRFFRHHLALRFVVFPLFVNGIR